MAVADARSARVRALLAHSANQLADQPLVLVAHPTAPTAGLFGQEWWQSVLGNSQQGERNRQIVERGVHELISMLQIDDKNICSFEETQLEYAIKLARSVIQASKEIVRDDPHVYARFAPNVRSVYMEYLALPLTTKGECVEQFLQAILDRSSSVESGQKRSVHGKPTPLKS